MIKVISTVHVGDEYEGEHGSTVADTKLVAHVEDPKVPVCEPLVSSVECTSEQEAQQIVKMYNDARDLGMSLTLTQTLGIVRES